ncbi:MAG: NapC/NirT family cytochrome c [Deltaproteobacteria bacterium]|nr:NapC/NirT family cytochrome c [Candidatus Tharpella aukensis]
MFSRMWNLLIDFIRDFGHEAARGTREHWKGLLVFAGVSFCIFILLIVLLLKASASYKFCAMCHNMDTYIQSWKQSSHKDVSCLACHFEPGVWGELKGKWKAQTHLVMKITGTAPPRPHTAISDASCLREGCHSEPELKGNTVNFKGVDFSHDTHLDELRRGKILKCVSCHSQIVQGEHLTVTETTCFNCHFYDKENHPEISDCQTCHTDSKAKIFIDANENMPFVHKDYVDRGVNCEQCHFGIIYGDGHVMDNVCVQCHSEPHLLEGSYSSEKMHFSHVTAHKVECFRCHSGIEHYIPREKSNQYQERQNLLRTKAISSGLHYDSNCAKCHTFDQHTIIHQMFAGEGGVEHKVMPSGMYQAHLDCAGCHLSMYEANGETLKLKRNGFDEMIKSCSECHGPGYDDMAKHWKEVLDQELAKTEKGLLETQQLLVNLKSPEGSQLFEIAQKNYMFVKNGYGIHNIDFALSLLADCRERCEKAKTIVDPAYQAATITSPSGCTELCHSCVECIETKAVPFGEVEFPHDVHVADEGLACLECHSPREQHGRTILKNCNDCHHGSGMGAVECADCHTATFNLYKGQNACDEVSCDVRGVANSMAEDVGCKDCHTQVEEGEAMTDNVLKQACIGCHDDDPAYGTMVDEWRQEVEKLDLQNLKKQLSQIQKSVLLAIRNGDYTYDTQDLINNADKNLKQLLNGNPIHNLEFAKDLVEKVKTLTEKARKQLQRHSTIKTLGDKEYKY